MIIHAKNPNPSPAAPEFRKFGFFMNKRLKDCPTVIEDEIEKEWVEVINKIFVFYWC